MNRIIAVCALVAPALLLSTSARADENPHLVEARRHYYELDYDGALEALRVAEAYPGTSRADLLEVHRLTVFAGLVTKKRDLAWSAARKLLALDPGHTLPAKTSPRFVKFLEKVRLEKGKEIHFNLSHTSPAAAEAFPVLLTATLDDSEKMVMEVLLHHRTVGAPTYSTMRIASERGVVTFSLPAPLAMDSSRVLEVEYFLEVRGKGGVRLATVGEEGAPLRLVVGKGGKKKGGGGVATKWWFWTALVGGAAVVATAVIVPVLLLRDGEPKVPPDSGIIRIIVEKP